MILPLFSEKHDYEISNLPEEKEYFYIIAIYTELYT